MLIGRGLAVVGTEPVSESTTPDASEEPRTVIGAALLVMLPSASPGDVEASDCPPTKTEL